MNILIYRLGSLGDTVVALPCFHAIAKAFPGSRRFLLTNEPVSVKAAPAELILAGSGLVDGVFSYPIRTRSPRKIGSLMAQLRAQRFDAAVYLTAPRSRLSLIRDYLFLRACGIGSIHGVPFNRDDYSNRRDPDGYCEYEAIRLSRCIRSLGPVDLEVRSSWDLQLTVDEISAADRALQPVQGRTLLAVNIGGKLPVQDWGDANWRATLQDVSAKLPRLAIVCVGSADERARIARLAQDLASPLLNLCGKLTPRETAAVFDRSTLFLGHDSGPMHLAASRQTRCVALFGSNNPPRIWHPYGSGHIVFHEHSGIAGIRPDAVVEAVERQLRATG